MKRARQLAAAAGGGIDPKFFDFVSQCAHVGITFMVTTVIGLVGKNLRHPYSSLGVGFGLCFVYAAIHEFYWDPTHEDAETRGSDVEDFIFLVCGALAACLCLIYL